MYQIRPNIYKSRNPASIFTYLTILVRHSPAEVVVLAKMAGNVVLSESLQVVEPLGQPAGTRYVHISTTKKRTKSATVSSK